MGAAPRLLITKDGEAVRTCTLDGEAVLGRSEGCVIRLDDRAVSRQHAVFRPVGDSVQVERKSEFAPLVVNGEECTTAVLREGDVISIGPYLLKLATGDAGSSGSSASGGTLAEAEAAGPARVAAPGSASRDAAAKSAAAPEARDRELGEIDFGGGSPGLGVDPNADVEFAANDLAEATGASALEPSSADAGASLAQPSEIELGFGGGAEGVNGAGRLDGGLGGNLASESPVEGLNAQFGAGDEAIDPGQDDAATKLLSTSDLVAQLIFEPGAANVRFFDIDRAEISIGRGKQCDIVLNDKKSSRKNTVIVREGNAFKIRDLDSSNGTYVNGERVTERSLAGDDLIQVGDVQFQFKAKSQAYEAQAANFPVALEPEMNDAGAASGDPVNPLDFGGAPESNAVPSDFSGLPLGLPARGGGIAQAGTRSNITANSMAGVSGIAGIGASAKANGSLVEKFKALPPTRRAIAAACVLALGYFLIVDEDPPAPPVKKGVTQVKKDAKGDKTSMAFEQLTPENQKFVEREHALAFDYFKNKEYDKSLFELNKIFALVPDYKNSREIERYAKEGKRKLDAIEEEKRKREEEARLKAQVGRLVEQTRVHMTKHEYDAARELFSQVLAVDPENKLVDQWRHEIQDYEDGIRIEAQKKQVLEEVNRKGWEIYKSAVVLQKANRYQSSIKKFQEVLALNLTTNTKLNRAAKAGIAKSTSLIETQRDPALAQGKEAEAAGELTRAFLYYKKATIIDPDHPEGYAGMNRIRGVLHDRAKVVYTEAVLAESFSDFALARKRFKECLEVAPEDDIYYERAKHKLSRYFKEAEPSNAQAPDGMPGNPANGGALK